MSLSLSVDNKNLIGVIQDILSTDKFESQEEIRDALRCKGLDVNQSSISRALRKAGISKFIDSSGKTVYRKTVDTSNVPKKDSISHQVTKILRNEILIIIHTIPGSASFVARYLDVNFPDEILGTVAGDNTIFVAPKSVQYISTTYELLKNSLL